MSPHGDNEDINEDSESAILMGKEVPAKKKRLNTFNHSQIEFLYQEFQKDQNWSKGKILKFAKKLGCTKHKKVYKWLWDRKKRL